MGSAKLASALPKEHNANGLLDFAGQMLARPQEMFVAVVVFDVSKVTRDLDRGLTIPTARVRRIEVVDDADDGNRLRQIMRRAWERRTGEAVLPIDMEDELDEIFGKERKPE